jgi:DNA helicase-2/ATP-dependent DNA helicase PcrA
MEQLRPSQEQILKYKKGRMAISAVPGSGKTWTLSRLAAEIINSGLLADDQEVLVVTLVNSAVDNFYQRVEGFIEDMGLLPNSGYRVRTLHGLAHDIVRERPGLVGLDNRFQIVDEREADAIRDDIAQAWLRSNPTALDDFLDRQGDENWRAWVRREKLPDLVKEIAVGFIRTAKDKMLSPERLRWRLDEYPAPLPLARMGVEIYTEYQRALAYRGGVDFDDLISLALQALQADDRFLQRLQQRWPFILEDEAQDSSRLQEAILHTLAANKGGWVRVGDPNQAIYETFTTASPVYLLNFLHSKGVQKRALPESGRSTPSIFNLANSLVKLVIQAEIREEVKDALTAPPWIMPAPATDQQANPPDRPDLVHLVVDQRYTPADELQAVAKSLENWLKANPDRTVAVLAPRNKRGEELVDELRKRQIPFNDSLLRSTRSTRAAAGQLGAILNYLADPQSARKLAQAYLACKRTELANDSVKARITRTAEQLRKIVRVEEYLWPGPGADWLLDLREMGVDQSIADDLYEFRRQIQRWQFASILPIDQILLTISQDLLKEPRELALAHKLAMLLRRAGQDHPAWRLPDMAGELQVIARNERRFLGFSADDTGFDPNKYKGTVLVATIHKAKGLEWDRVYLMSVNNYDFPIGDEADQFIAEKFFVRDRLNMVAETLSQLEAATTVDPYFGYEEGRASRQARDDYARERLRLLYVGITRAKSELVITWNTGQRGDMRPAVALLKLNEIWRKSLAVTSDFEEI